MGIDHTKIKSKISKNDRHKIIDSYATGESVLKLSKSFPYSYDVIHYFLTRCGVKIRSNKVTARKYFYDENFFEEIDTEEKAYWLGFLFADGYISKDEYTYKFGCALADKDKNHLNKLVTSLKSNTPVHNYKASKSSFKEGAGYSRVIFVGDKICKDLMRYGCTEHKSRTLKFPMDHIPKVLIRDFIRGYIDGDGSITKTFVKSRNCFVYTVKIVGTYEFLKGIHHEFKETLSAKFNPRKRDESHINTYSQEYGGELQVEWILNYLYKDANIFLDRKYNIFKEFVEYHNIVRKGYRRKLNRY
ncbi:hypothetical protein GCM10008931_44430 [Oceanobacillus oncorhynchi subsp. oncorhynchi]|uniref:hypothetical protein n=1 Tax=Oceanobacillus oncorhynchi TaxID=545501 RepID=UPI0031DB8E8A